VPARLALADAHEQAGLVAQAWRERGEVGRAQPLVPAAVSAQARAARSLDRVDEAALLLRKALALRHDDEAARSSLTQVLLDRGDLEGALDLLAEEIQLDPARLAARLRRADLLASNGRHDEAEAGYAAAERIAPEEAEVKERRGQARLRAGRTKDALADFQAALELRPQNPRLKELVRAIEPARERFEAPYVQDWRELAKEHERSRPASTSDDDAVILGDLRVTRVYPSGLHSSYTQRIVKILTQRGADAFRSHAVGYAPDRQELRVDRVRVVKPDGAVVETFQESDRSASEPWYRLYYDTRLRTLSFPALSPGDILEVAVRLDDVAGENLLSDYFGEVVYLGDGTRRTRADYVLLVPESRPIASAEARLPGPSRRERAVPGGLRELRWSARDLPRIEPEPGMPGWAEVAPFIHVSTYSDWSQVASFYWNLVREQLRPTPEIRELAARLAAEVKQERRARGAPEEGDDLAFVQAAHRFVVTNIRYVGLELGIHGFKPYRVDQILERRFGDCKDKASLTHALLEAQGIDARLVLLRTKRLGRIPERPASLAVFNHAILRVPRWDLWLDGTASYSGTRDLPDEDRGATVLVVNPAEPPLFGTVPEARPGENRSESTFEASLSPDGSAVVRGAARVAGGQAPAYRRAYQAENDRGITFEQSYSRTFPGLSVRELSVSDLSRLEDDVELRFTLAVPRFADRDGRGLSFLPFGAVQSYAETYGGLSRRRHDLALGEPYESTFAWRYALPQGWEVAELPAAVAVDAPTAAFEVSYRAEPGAVLARGRVLFKKGRLGAEEYPAFRELVSGLDRALSRRVRIAPAPGPTASRAGATDP